MGKGREGQVMTPVIIDKTYTWDEVKKHNSRYDKWLVIKNGVYDVTRWMSKHPGGFKVLSHYGGEDATEAFTAFHPDKKLVRKYMKPLCIGSLEDDTPKNEMVTDMEALRIKAEQMGLFKANPWFYAAHLAHIIAAEVFAWCLLKYCGVGWLSYIVATVLLTTEQAQSSWYLHDLGHLSVFRKSRWNHLLQHFVAGGLKGSSAHWWNYRHYQHHAKPNIITKDPDIKMPYIFVLGDKEPIQWGQSKRKYILPFNYQQIYFFFTFTAFHPDKKLVRKYMKPLCIGSLEDDTPKNEMVTDMEALRIKAEQMGLFKANPWFYAAHLAHIIAAEVFAWCLLKYCGVGWLSYIVATVLLTTEQAQSSWYLHDLGHLSVFRKSRWNHLLQHFVAGGLKGSSAHWWNYRHYQHHAKPNIITKDPDIKMPYIFVLGDKEPIQWGQSKRKYILPFNYQQIYFFFTLPALLLPVYFHYEYFVHVIKKRRWQDMAWMIAFFIKHFLLFGPMLGIFGVLVNYMLVRCLESHWFVWTSQMNHIPMEIDVDRRKEWLPSQLQATCNVESSFFNDWFTGHLNFQIEHHLFPTMPRHNLHKMVPDAKALCKKYNLNYQVKTLSGAFADIVRSLKHSGQLWYDAYYHI